MITMEEISYPKKIQMAKTIFEKVGGTAARYENYAA